MKKNLQADEEKVIQDEKQKIQIQEDLETIKKNYEVQRNEYATQTDLKKQLAVEIEKLSKNISKIIYLFSGVAIRHKE